MGQLYAPSILQIEPVFSPKCTPSLRSHLTVHSKHRLLGVLGPVETLSRLRLLHLHLGRPFDRQNLATELPMKPAPRKGPNVRDMLSPTNKTAMYLMRWPVADWAQKHDETGLSE